MIPESSDVAYSEVDSDRFGVRIARARMNAENLDRVFRFCGDQKIALLIARAKTDDWTAIHGLEQQGSLLMDVLVYYSFDLQKREVPQDLGQIEVRSFRSDDAPQIEQVAASSFKGYFGHYHADPRLDRRKADEGYTSWAVRSCAAKDVADEVLVADRDCEILGFATLRMNSPQEGEGVLFGVAPEAQGLGIYRSFMIAGMQWCKRQNAQKMVVSTQVTNIAVQKVWCRVGFEPSHSYCTFHKWF